MDKKMDAQYLGTDMGFDADGDLLVTPTGDMAVVSGVDCLVQNVLDRLKTIPGDLYHHEEWGNHAGRMLGTPDTPLNRALVAKQIRIALEAEPRIDPKTIEIRTQVFTNNQKTFYIGFTPMKEATELSLVWGFGTEDIAEVVF